MKFRAIIYGLVIIIAMTIVSGCARLDLNSKYTVIESASDTTKTPPPEETLIGFREALKSDDLTKVLNFFSVSAVDQYRELLADVNLSSLGADIQKFPPIRIDDPREDDARATFVSKRTIDNKIEEADITLSVENG